MVSLPLPALVCRLLAFRRGRFFSGPCVRAFFVAQNPATLPAALTTYEMFNLHPRQSRHQGRLPCPQCSLSRLHTGCTRVPGRVVRCPADRAVWLAPLGPSSWPQRRHCPKGHGLRTLRRGTAALPCPWCVASSRRGSVGCSCLLRLEFGCLPKARGCIEGRLVCVQRCVTIGADQVLR